MTTRPDAGGGSFFSGHDLLATPLAPIAPRQVRAAALHVVSRSASQEEAGTFLHMLGISALEVDQGMFYSDAGGVS